MSQPTHPSAAFHSHAPAQTPPLDLREKGGTKDGVQQTSDRRLFMQLTAFGGCRDSHKLLGALGGAGVDCVLYEELNDPTGVAVLAMSDDPALLLGKLRRELNAGAFAGLTVKPEFSMLGRTYALGYEPQLEDWLLHRPKRVVSDPAQPWAVWYPLRRTGAFARLPRPEQMQILKEHGVIGRQFGDAGVAQDVRLACQGLDKHDNDFVIGLIGKELHPLSALVETMRPTVQTSQYIQNMGPFFVGRAIWHSSSKEAVK
ncbi:MAG TPA: chlorite dismutase family protein [Elusimicrobiota bacterium]|nr:chlorite dismutase family protein [Elusimicrobiota bacterium]